MRAASVLCPGAMARINVGFLSHHNAPTDVPKECTGSSSTYPDPTNVLFSHLFLTPTIPIHPIYHFASFLSMNSFRMLTIFSKLVSQASSSLLTRSWSSPRFL
jgi:hypothetical protein